MAKLVLTVVGDDRAGLVQSLADVVSEHGGNWETSELAELAGAFAGIVLVSVPDARLEELREALHGLDGLLRVTVHGGADAGAGASGRRLTFSVLGDDRPGIVREVTGILSRHGVTIDLFSSHTREAPMAGGVLFEARIAARVPDGVETAAVVEELERLAAEIQVDVALDD
ncbi:glycine cleavage system protein R [Humibacter sp.]|jgi:glycine cleavage system regulatory protein|uniref:glycine cleavage system protein R n=1 Tax=Humibacter sp. TaxID=1940291 RepID=UPI002B68CAAD|nr:ACT domain-containing protein [Humibacter sp.]HVX08399.1 ACT domain-containing protein [Humibacter sp.]